MKHFVNLLPHAVTLRRSDGSDLTLTPSGAVARVDSRPGGRVDAVGGVDIHAAPAWGDVVGLPAPDADPDAVYIVSALVAARCPGREDVVSPGTGPADGAVRNEAGQIQAVTRLIRAPR